jgi:hypothetical protein
MSNNVVKYTQISDATEIIMQFARNRNSENASILNCKVHKSYDSGERAALSRTIPVLAFV